jgi:hypothetical protein
MSPFQIMSILRKEFQSKIEESLTLARAVSTEESQAWDNHLKSLALTPMTIEERKQRSSLNNTIHTGALPIELRSVLEFHSTAILQTMNTYKNEFGHFDWWNNRVETPFLKVVNDMPQQTLTTYIGTIRSQSAAIFENAAEVSYGYFETTVRSNSKSHLCPTCRAARSANTDLTICSFCGTPLF